ncbi:rRNA pseudouridine synthase, partial [Candidatus Woesearchaeota archaeon]|nr:rRNA pseudouridine synthase [Candidatus Woesearchaeota archaeon]
MALVNSNRVTIDGISTAALKFQFSPKKRTVCIDGKPISFVSKKYLVLNKPAGYSCQKNGNFPYVVSLLACDDATKNSLFPIGRLDVPTTGLLIITNDGTLSALLAEPKRNVTKTYHALLKQKITDEQIIKLRQGVIIQVDGEEYKTLPPKVNKISWKSENNIEIIITEGKYRQVRKMLEAV